ncbi:MAG TPA: tetratricopeptide repeat protein [Candidatus Eisenbacteria bacterium]|nr:tetratricopeptide repeat protein [Candidatus Eisenbacteria bacterium]
MLKRFGGSSRPWTLGLLLLLAGGGCAYYNTFYLAKKNYREGNKAQERSLSEAPAQEAIGRYDVVIRQCQKVLTDYPKSKYVDDAAYMMGASYYGKGDYPNAIQQLTSFASKYPKSPYRADARFTEGLARYRRKEFVESDSIFREVEGQYPDFSRRWELYFYSGETQAQLKHYTSAAHWYRLADKRASGRREKSKTLRRLGDAYLSAEHADSAEVAYAECLKVEERGPQRVDAAIARGDALRKLGRYPEALQFYQSWRVFAAQEGREGDILLRIYDVMAVMGKPQDALKGYNDLVTRFPRTSVAYEAQFQIGYLYETAIQDLDAAGREYDKLKGQPTSEFQQQAMRRSQSLAAIRSYRNALASDSTGARARAAFMMAELNYFQLEKQDSAIAQYQRVETEFPHSVYAAKAAYARLWIATQDKGDTLEAMRIADMMGERYRGTPYAESGLYLWKQWSGRTDERTALLDSLLANPDTSQVVVLEPEIADSTLVSPVDSTFGRPQIHVMTPADSARMDSLSEVARIARDKYIREHGGVPRPRPQQQAHPQGPAPQVQTPTPSAPNASDPAAAAGAAAAGAAAGGSAPADSSTNGTPPPATTAAPDSTARPDSTAHEDEDDTGP